jgi:putative membrane protein
MKRFLFALALVTACRGENNITTTDTINTSGTETTGTTSTTSTGSSGGTVSALNSDDKEFFIAAAQANLSEIELGQMARDKATGAGVKTFAERMITDHGQANEELKQLALKKGVALPAVVNKDQAKSADDLSKKVGMDFDKSYMAQMIRDHEAAVSKFRTASQSATDPDLKAWAAKTLPTLQNHLTMAKQIAAKT